jgi:hypothetical protein
MTVKKIIVALFIVVIWFTVICSMYFVDSSKHTNYNFSYTWTITTTKDNILLYNNFSWKTIDWGYDILHIIQPNISDNLIKVYLRQIYSWWLSTLSVEKSNIIYTPWNHWLDIYKQHFGQKNNIITIPNKDLTITTSHTTKWLLYETIFLQWKYINQLKEPNLCEIKISSYCWMSQYIFKTYTCTIQWTIQFNLPIQDNQVIRKINWSLYNQRN